MSWGTELWVSVNVQGSTSFFYFMLLCKLEDCMFVTGFYCPWVQKVTRPISGGVLFFTAA